MSLDLSGLGFYYPKTTVSGFNVDDENFVR